MPWQCAHCNTCNDTVNLVCQVCGKYTTGSREIPTTTVTTTTTTPSTPPLTTTAPSAPNPPTTPLEDLPTSTLQWVCHDCDIQYFASETLDCGCCGGSAPFDVTEKAKKSELPSETFESHYEDTPTPSTLNTDVDVSDEHSDADLLFPCDVCGMGVSVRILGQHLAGHFTAEAINAGEVPYSDGSCDDDKRMAAALQREELVTFLAGLDARVQDRVTAIKLAHAGANQEKKRKEQEQEKENLYTEEEEFQNKPGFPRKLRPFNAEGSVYSGLHGIRQRPRMLAIEQMVSAHIERTLEGHARGNSTIAIKQTDPLYLAVADFFALTLIGRGSGVAVMSITQWCSQTQYLGFKKKSKDVKHNLMFHGCRTLQNEESIRTGGFKVSKCISGGASFGTWFAFNATYSDGGFVYRDAKTQVARILLCLVARQNMKIEDQTMRVVGQDCAYPAMVIEYRTGR